MQVSSSHAPAQTSPVYRLTSKQWRGLPTFPAISFSPFSLLWALTPTSLASFVDSPQGKTPDVSQKRLRYAVYIIERAKPLTGLAGSIQKAQCGSSFVRFPAASIWEVRLGYHILVHIALVYTTSLQVSTVTHRTTCLVTSATSSRLLRDHCDSAVRLRVSTVRDITRSTRYSTLSTCIGHKIG